jgi:hypothetical protein
MIKYNLSIIILLQFICCISPIQPDLKYKYNIPIKIGDTSQVIETRDSSTLLIAVVSKTHRHDGKEVFVIIYKYGKSLYDTSYIFYENGYLISTLLDTVKNSNYLYADTLKKNKNYFYEKIIYSVNSIPGDSFQQCMGDNDHFYWTVDTLSSKKSICNNFNNILEFTLHLDSNNIWGKTYYANNIGYIGTTFGFNEKEMSCSYIKRGNQIYGSLWAEKDTPHFEAYPY